MKKLLTLLFSLLLSSYSVFADDISDFEIEGIAIGDSLLDYFSEEEILNKKKDWFNNNEFSVSSDFKLPSFKTYDSVQIGYKTEDKKFTIMGIEGYIYFEDKDKDIKNCYKIQNKVIKELSDLFPNTKKGKKKTYKHNDPTTNDIITSIAFYLDPADQYGDKVMVACVNRKDHDRYNNLVIILRSEEYAKFIKDKAYK